jgi:hypothetical protein
MAIRKKIFLLAGILLALFGVVVGTLAMIQKLDSDDISNVVDYDLPLSRLVAEFDVYTDRYELGILRALRPDAVDGGEIQAAISAMRALSNELRKTVATATALLTRAIQDPAYQTASRELDLVTVAGKTEPVRIFEAMARAGELKQEQHDLRELFSQGLSAYRRQDWNEAHAQFERCLQIAPHDGPAHLFIERIVHLRNASPTADWGGIWHHADK